MLSTPLAAQWTVESRLYTGGMFDSNIGEDTRNRTDAGLQANAAVDAVYTTPSDAFLHEWNLSLKTTNLFFGNHFDKSRTLNQLSASYTRQVSKGFYLQPLARFESKNYLRDNRNYRVIGGGIAGLLKHHKSRSLLTLEATRTKTYFNSFTNYNNLSDVITGTVDKFFSEMNHCRILLMAGNHQYSKYAWSRENRYLDIRQRDNTFGAGLMIELYFFKTLFRADYQYHAVFSNSYGSSFYLHRINLMGLRPLGKGLFIKAYASTLWYKYPDTIISPDISIYQPGLDDKMLVLELGKKLPDEYEIKLRLHWYANQILFTSMNYNRSMLSLGIEKDFNSKPRE